MAGQVGRMREWSTIPDANKGQSTRTYVTARPEGDRVRISLEQVGLKAGAVGITIGGGIQLTVALVLGTVAALGVEPDLWIPAVMLLMMGVLMIGGTQIGYRAWVRHQAAKYEGVLDRLDLIARDVAPERVPERAAAPAAPRLDLDALAEPEREEPAPVPTRRRTQT